VLSHFIKLLSHYQDCYRAQPFAKVLDQGGTRVGGGSRLGQGGTRVGGGSRLGQERAGPCGLAADAGTIGAMDP
jgi:hypothetical protein